MTAIANKRLNKPADRMFEIATVERQSQRGGVVVERMVLGVKGSYVRHRARFECVLDKYVCDGKISQSEFKAGMRFREAWLIKAEGVKTRDSLQSQSPSGKIFDPLCDKTWAEGILSQAFKTAGLTLAQATMVQDICGCDQEVGLRYFPTLQRALCKLAKFWNL